MSFFKKQSEDEYFAELGKAMYTPKGNFPMRKLIRERRIIIEKLMNAQQFGLVMEAATQQKKLNEFDKAGVKEHGRPVWIEHIVEPSLEKGL